MKRAIGVISGTSMDGIDVAIVDTDGEIKLERGPGATLPYPDELRTRLLAVLQAPEAAASGDLGMLEAEVTRAHASAVVKFLEVAGIDRRTIHVAGFHGQTILHRPEQHFTRQLCDGNLAASIIGIDVITQFRQADMTHGGQGAPLVPLYHKALAACTGLEGPLMVLNLGGVGNVTYLDGDVVIAFDSGPASALIDDWVRRHACGDFDRDGTLANAGTIAEDRLALLLAERYFKRAPPKSLDRNHFHRAAAVVEGLTVEDGAATLTAFTVAATAGACAHVPKMPTQWIVAGGGRHNRAIMSGLSKILGVSVLPVETVGWDGDFLEAECFGYLAVRSLKGLPLSLPTTTGVSAPMCGGTFHPAPIKFQ